jgi:hypothetical protein
MKQFLRTKERIISTHSVVQVLPPGGGAMAKLILTHGDPIYLTTEEWDVFEPLLEKDCERLDRRVGWG